MNTAYEHTRSTNPAGATDADWKFCATMLPKVSRTFALSIGALPPELREAIRVAYLLCRAVDTIEDDAVVVGEAREQLYDMFDLLMNDDGADPEVLAQLTADYALGAGSDDHVLCLNAGAVFRCYRALPIEQRTAIRPHVLEMSRGMREFTRRADSVGRLRLSSLDELERYCYFVAGTVGKLLTALFEEHITSISGPLPQHLLTPIRARSVSFGLALQLVNIVKDVAEDLPRGDCFLPEDLAHDEGVALDDILEPQHRSAGMAIINRVCDRARDHLKRAEQYTLLWPAEEGADVRMFCTVPLVLALATLHEVEQGGDTLTPGRTPKITRQAVTSIFADTRIAIRRNDTLRWMIGYYKSGAYLDSDALPAPAKERVSTMPAPMPPTGNATPRTTPTLPPAASVPPPAVPLVEKVPSEAKAKVLVTGASGQLGANLVRELVSSGQAVRVLLRRGSNNTAMDGLAVERIYGDVRDRDAVDDAVRGCHRVFHCAAHITPTPQDDAARAETVVDGTKNVLASARKLGVERVIVTTRFGATGRDASDVDRAERACVRAASEGLDVVVVSPAALVGAHDFKPSVIGRTLTDFAGGKLRDKAAGGCELTVVGDAVRGLIAAAKSGRSGEKYTLASEFLSADELFASFEEVTGVPLPARTLANRVWRALSGSGVGQELTSLLTEQKRANTEKARSELGFAPTDVRVALLHAYDSFAERGLVSPRMRIVDGETKAPNQPRRAAGAAA